LQETDCTGTDQAAAADTCNNGASPPVSVAPGGAITPPSSAPPLGDTYSLYDTDGNQLYATAGVYSPTGTYEYSRTTYQLFKGNTVTLNSTNISCTNTPPISDLPCATINADGVVTQLKYDSAGDLTSTSTPDGNSGGEAATTTYTYDGDGEQLTKVSPDGNLAGANSGNYTTTTAWNPDSQQTSITEGNGTGYTDTPRQTSYSYDADSNQTQVQDARGYTTTTAFNADDQATLVTNPDNDATLTCYDGDGNTAQTIPAVGVAAGSLTAASCPSAYPAGYGTRLAADATVSTFDAAGDMTAQTTPAPAGQSGYETTTWTYDGSGEQLSESQPPAANGGSSQVTLSTYTSTGQLATQTSGYGTTAASTTSYCYTPTGQQASVVYGDGNAGGVASCATTYPWSVTASPQKNYQTTYTYDSAADLVSTVSPADSASSTPTTANTYDPAGNVMTSTDPDGVTTTWTYTPQNHVATLSFSNSSAPAVSYAYDAGGDETSVTDASGTSANVYNTFGELTSTQNGAGQVTGFSYDADGDGTATTYPLPSTASSWDAGNATVSYGYDKADQLTSVTDFNGHVIGITDTPDGLQASLSLGSTGDSIATTYDPTDSPSSITLKNSSATLQSFTYSDTPAGNLLSEADGPGAQSPASYTYDGEDRVSSMTPAGSSAAQDYGFDSSGNLTTLPTGALGCYNDAGELTGSGTSCTNATINYTYNADGERLTSTQGSTVLASGTWNGAQQLATFNSSAGDMTAATYNGNGLRTSSTIEPSNGSPTTQNYVWDGYNLLMDSQNAYIYAGGTAPVEQVSLAHGTISYLDTDCIGSVRSIVSASGTLTGTASYDAWGNPSASGGLTANTPFGYAGAYTDADGLLYLINRYYDPSTGQFISVDPDLAQTGQAYEYGVGDPVSNTDPMGLSTTISWNTCNRWGTCYGTEYDLLSKVYEGQHSGDWTHCLYVTAQDAEQWPSCNKSVTVTAEVDGTIGAEIPKSILSAEVGFNVSYSTSTGNSDGFQINPGGHGFIDAGFRYKLWKLTEKKRSCAQSSYGAPITYGKWSKVYSGSVQQILGVTYKYFGTGAVK
jgi:RHS repeat-associated protein